MDFPRIVISGLRGGSGKTIVSIGLIAALKNKGKSVAPYKKGPDYIDAGWLALSAGRPCYNLDTFIIEENQVLSSFLSHTLPDDFSVIEGNRGLFDGIDIEGATSTAELAKLLKAPVILCVDCTKSTRTIAAVVSGCIQFDDTVDIRGIILNRVAGGRHENVLRKNIEHYCGIPVVGALPKLKKQSFPERHMGLLPAEEHRLKIDSIRSAEETAIHYLDLDAIEAIGRTAPKLKMPEIVSGNGLTAEITEPGPTVGIIKDSAFQFYYPDNLEALTLAGAKVKIFSPLTQSDLTGVDAVYIGGGFPETHAQALADNERFRKNLKHLIENGLPVYAECGGLMYLGKTIFYEGKTYPMCDVLPIHFGFSKRPQGHGYTVVTVDRDNPYFAVGAEIRGHEFHYSNLLSWEGSDSDLVFSMNRGNGIVNGRDGLCYKNVLATYTHLHALGAHFWAPAVVRNAGRFNNSRS